MSKFIWCLFSVENNYDQPEHNLVRFWCDKPELTEFAKAFNMNLSLMESNDVVSLVQIWQGFGTTLHGPGTTRYTLKKVEEGQILE